MTEEKVSWNVFDQRLTRLETMQENLGKDVLTIAQSVDSMMRNQAVSGRTNWTTVLGALGILITAMTVGATLIESRSDARLAPINLSESYMEKRIEKLQELELKTLVDLTVLKTKMGIEKKD